MFTYPIYNHNWRNISTIYIYNKTNIKRNILTIRQNTSEVGRAKDLSVPLYNNGIWLKLNEFSSIYFIYHKDVKNYLSIKYLKLYFCDKVVIMPAFYTQIATHNYTDLYCIMIN
jgi:hypothetical protein